MGFRLQISYRVPTASVDNPEKYAKLSLVATGMALSEGLEDNLAINPRRTLGR